RAMLSHSARCSKSARSGALIDFQFSALNATDVTYRFPSERAWKPMHSTTAQLARMNHWQCCHQSHHQDPSLVAPCQSHDQAMQLPNCSELVQIQRYASN